MAASSTSSRASSQLPGQRGFRHQPTPRHSAQRIIRELFCGTTAALLLLFLSCSLFLFWMPTPASAAPAATSCPTSNLPATPTAGAPFDPASIKLSELLTNPKKDWNCDGKLNGDDRWIELINLSGSDASLFGLQLCCDANNQPYLLLSTNHIASNGFLLIFLGQIGSKINISPNGGTLELLDGQGNAIDTVNYPSLGLDQSYIRDSSGQWSTSDTPTPGAPNVNGSSPGPTPTSTRRSSSGGGSGGGGKTPTATPTPIGSVFIPTDTPDLALHSPGHDASSGGNGGSDTGLTSWIKTTLLVLMAAGLLAVVVWYIRSWGKESESDT